MIKKKKNPLSESLISFIFKGIKLITLLYEKVKIQKYPWIIDIELFYSRVKKIIWQCMWNRNHQHNPIHLTKDVMVKLKDLRVLESRDLLPLWLPILIATEGLPDR